MSSLKNMASILAIVAVTGFGSLAHAAEATPAPVPGPEDGALGPGADSSALDVQDPAGPERIGESKDRFGFGFGRFGFPGFGFGRFGFPGFGFGRFGFPGFGWGGWGWPGFGWGGGLGWGWPGFGWGGGWGGCGLGWGC